MNRLDGSSQSELVAFRDNRDGKVIEVDEGFAVGFRRAIPRCEMNGENDDVGFAGELPDHAL